MSKPVPFAVSYSEIDDELAREAGRQARRDGLPRRSALIAEFADRARKWIEGWDEQDALRRR